MTNGSAVTHDGNCSFWPTAGLDASRVEVSNAILMVVGVANTHTSSDAGATTEALVDMV